MQDFLNRISGFSPKRLALLAYELQRRVDELESSAAEPIAIVGVGCRLPGGVSDPDSYWTLLGNGVDAITEVPSDRWNVDDHYHPNPDAPGKMSTRWGGFVRNVDGFDPQFFGISPREAESMDPQQRLLLEVAWEALEHAGISPERIFGTKTGVFVGMSANDYSNLIRANGLSSFDAYTASGTAHSIASGRLSYVLGARGPSISIDTACSSSLVAIHQAVTSLRAKECDLTLAGGVNLILGPDVSIALSRSHMMAPDGRCKTFDARADGFVRGEGCGIIVLKLLRDAQAARDRVIAVIRGSAVNQDGRSNGLTAPNGHSQEAVLRDALANAHVDPALVSYVEAHGTGTSLGDPIEVQALGAVFGAGRDAANPLHVGSVKTNIGHLEAAAGVAGVIKVALALQRAELPAQLHFEQPNPFIPWSDLPIEVTTRRTPWAQRDGQLRLAGVSSFGFSGTNAHLILEEAPPIEDAHAVVERSLHVLAMSARTDEALTALTDAYSHRLSVGDDRLADIAYTADTGRTHLAHRLAIVASSREQALMRLSTFRADGHAAGVVSGVASATRRPKIAFLFTGQGAQYRGMGRSLYETYSVFRDALDRMDEILRPMLSVPLLSVVFADPDAEPLIDQTEYTQPALFAVEYALTALWASWGVTPTAVAGHSLGEYVAACVAGVLSVEDALALVVARARLMGELPAGGAMAAIHAGETKVKAVIEPYQRDVAIAAINGPMNTVISGSGSAIQAITSQFESMRVEVTRLNVSHAFHSPLIAPMLDELEQVANTITYRSPELDLVSNVTGGVARADMIAASYWREHASSPVRFADGITTLMEQGYNLFVEIGPHPVLMGMGRAIVPEGDATWLPSLRKGRPENEQMLESLATLYVNGGAIDWAGHYREHNLRKVVLPSYPFQRERYWIPDRNIREGVPHEIADLLHEVKWRDAGSADDMLPSPSTLAERVMPLVADASKQTGFDLYGAFKPKLDDLARIYIIQAFQQLGWSFAPGEVVTAEILSGRLGVAARHGRLLERMLAILSEDGILDRSAGGWRVTHTPPVIDAEDEWSVLAERNPTFAPELTLTRRCAGELASVLRGETDPLQLLFPGGSMEDAERLYRDSAAARTYNGLIAEVVRAAAVSAPRGRALRILEIGAGTGGTTSYVLPVLTDHRVEYTFTDISPLFAARARETFRDWPFMRYEALDVSRDPAEQGFEDGAYDIILASNVLHATPDLGATMANVRRLLAPDGLVVLLEGTSPQRYGDLTVGMTDGWWAFTDVERRNYALMDRSAWLTLFNESGFVDAVAIPGADAGAALSQQAIFVARAGERVDTSATWIVVGDEEHLADALTLQLRTSGDNPVLVRADDTAHLRDLLLASGTETQPVAGILYLSALDIQLDDTTSPTELAAGQRRQLGGMLEVIQDAVGATPAHPPAIWAVTRGAQPTHANESTNPAQASLWGMCHVVATEHPEFSCTRVDLDPASDVTQDARALVRLLHERPSEDQVAFRDARRLVRRLTRVPASAGIGLPTVFRSDATYLITGGLRGLGLRVAEWLADRGARHLVLMSRRGADAAADAVIRRLETRGVVVHAVAGDVSNRRDVEDVLAQIKRTMPKLAGVVHAAGVLDDGVVAHLTWERFERVLRPKVLGTWHLHTLTSDLDFLVLFSSGASLAGSAGQANHAAANAFEDALAYRRQAAGLPTVSINWGPWSEIGAAADRQVSALQFMDAISPQDGLAALDWAMRRDPVTMLFVQPQVGVLRANWELFLRRYERGEVPPLFSELATGERRVPVPSAAPEPEVNPADTLRRSIETSVPNRRRAVLRDFVTHQAIKVLGGERQGRIDVTQPLRDVGLDSLMAVELRNVLGRAVDRTLPSTLTFDHPTVDALVDYLASEVFASEIVPAVQQGQLDETRERADALDDLSEEALASLLSEQLHALDRSTDTP